MNTRDAEADGTLCRGSVASAVQQVTYVGRDKADAEDKGTGGCEGNVNSVNALVGVKMGAVLFAAPLGEFAPPRS